MDDGFALRDETIRLLEARVKELEEEKIQRESWSFQEGGEMHGDKEGEIHGDKDGDETNKDGDKADKDGDDEPDKEGEDGDKADKDGDDEPDKEGEDGDEADKGDEAEKDGEKQIEAEADKGDEAEKDSEKQIEAEAEKDGEKHIEVEAEKLMQVDTEDGDEQSTLQIMADTAERFEKAAAEKAAVDKTDEVVDDDALEKEGEVRVDDALENTASVGDSQDPAEMPKRVPKRSHLLRTYLGIHLFETHYAHKVVLVF
ncbi:hypothetical protein Bca4012_103705 [Brassica carinata]